MTPEEIRAARNRLDEIQAELEQLAGVDDTNFTDANQARWDGLSREGARLRRDLDLQEIRTAARDPQRVEAGTHVGNGDGRGSRGPWDFDAVRRTMFSSPEQMSSELRSRALSAIEQAPAMNDGHREAATSKLERLFGGVDVSEDSVTLVGAAKVARHILAVSDPAYIRGFNEMLRNFTKAHAVVIPDVVARAASLTDAAGGYAVPLPVDPTLVVNDDGSVNPWRRLATVRPATTDVVRTINATAVVASWDGEAAEVSDDTPTFANTDVTLHKAQAFVPFSIEIGEDYPGFVEDMRMLFSDAKDNLEAAAFATGTGTNQPWGVVTRLTGTAYEIPSNTADTFAVSDVYDLEEELPERYRQNASFVANKRIYQAIREAGGSNLDDFWANLREGIPATLLGYPAYEASAMDGVINAAAENYVMVFGDLRYYRIFDRVGLSVELVPHLFGANRRPTGQRGLYAYWRTGADLQITRAARLLNVT